MHLGVRGQTDRLGQLQAAERLMQIDSNEAAARTLRSVLQDDSDSLHIDSITGVAYHKLGVLAYYADDIVASADNFRRAVEVRDQVFPGPHNERAHSRGNLAYMYRLLDKLDSTAVRVREANAIYAELPEVDTLNWLRSLNELGALALSQENYLMGYSSSYRAVALVEEMGEVDPYEAFVTYYRAARILLRLDKAGEALPFAHHAVNLSTESGELPLMADALNLLSIIQRALDDHQASYSSLERAVRLPLDPDDDALTLAFINANLAIYYARNGDRDRFATHNRRAKLFFQRTDALREYYLLDRIPLALYEWGDYPATLDHLNEGLGYLTGGDPTHLSLTDIDSDGRDLVPIVHLLDLKARTLTNLARHTQALDDYELLFSLQERLREGVGDHASRSYHSGNLRPLFDRAIGLYYSEYVRTEDTSLLWKTFALSEKARAYSLLAALQSGGQQTREERNLLDRIARLERDLSLERDGSQLQLATARLQLERLYFNRQAKSPTPAPPIDRAALVGYLSERQATLLEYHFGAETGLLFALTPEGKLAVYPLPGSESLGDNVSAFREAITQGKYRRKSLRPESEQAAVDHRYLRTGTELTYQLLPATFREELHLRPRLIVVPDGILHYLPFAALPLDTVDRAGPLDYREVDYLHRHADISYAYSGNYLMRITDRGVDTFTTQLLAFAPSFGGRERVQTAEVRTSGELLRSGGQLSPLRYNQEEVAEIAGLIAGAVTYVGQQATRERFTQQLTGSRILHLSSHGMVDAADPNLSFIAFAQGEELRADQLLYFNDLYGMPLDNELTVLSACETALGRLQAGETTMSMASAFAAAGARSTVTTLWQVDDAATKDIIVDFYRGLVSGKTRATALHDAQSRQLETEYAHPYYWSGIMLYGTPDTLSLDMVNADGYLPWWGWLIVAGLVAGLLFYVLRFLYGYKPADL